MSGAYPIELLRQSLIARIVSAEDLPELPETAFRIMQLTQNPNADPDRVARAILSSPTLSARVLRYVNSPFYGLLREVTSIHQAVVILGLDTIRDLVVGLSMVDLFLSQRPVRFNQRRFNDLALQAAVVSSLMAPQVDLAPEEAFIAGLLHDIGTLLLGRYHPEILQQILDAKRETGEPIVEIEQRFTGLDHTVIGHWLASQWDLPNVFRVAIRHHHEPGLQHTDDPDSARMVRVVILADRIVRLFRRHEPTDMEHVSRMWVEFFDGRVHDLEAVLTAFPRRLASASDALEAPLEPVVEYEAVRLSLSS
ncbi:MAG: HDOD domain-containing protein [Proteobacteria bacterium]|nr:HDOD domain-containing protein [Pseudomonadota bacterium]